MSRFYILILKFLGTKQGGMYYDDRRNGKRSYEKRHGCN